MSARTWSFTISELGRPLLSNRARKMHQMAETSVRVKWRDAARLLAYQQRIPKGLGSIDVIAQARYRTRRSPSDCDATSPTVKGVIDGLVLAGVIVDDKAPFVASVTYLSPLVGTGLPDGLIVTVIEHGADTAGQP